MDVTQIGQVATEYGIGMAMFLGLLVWVFKKQAKLDEAAHKREEDHHKYMDALKEEIYAIACKNHTIVRTISDDVDMLHDKMTGLSTEVEKVRVGVDDIQKSVHHIQNTMVIKSAKQSEDDE